jgi:hypothetical protein
VCRVDIEQWIVQYLLINSEDFFYKSESFGKLLLWRWVDSVTFRIHSMWWPVEYNPQAIPHIVAVKLPLRFGLKSNQNHWRFDEINISPNFNF